MVHHVTWDLNKNKRLRKKQTVVTKVNQSIDDT